VNPVQRTDYSIHLYVTILGLIEIKQLLGVENEQRGTVYATKKKNVN